MMFATHKMMTMPRPNDLFNCRDDSMKKIRDEKSRTLFSKYRKEFANERRDFYVSNSIATIEQPLPVRTGTGGRRTLVQLEFY